MKRNTLLIISITLLVISILAHTSYTVGIIKLAEFEYTALIIGLLLIGLAFLFEFVRRRTQRLWAAALVSIATGLSILLVDTVAFIFLSLGDI